MTRKFQRYKVYWSYWDNIWDADLADMQIISKYNKGVRFLVCVVDIYSKYTWAVLWKDRKGITSRAFQKIWMSLGVNQTQYG